MRIVHENIRDSIDREVHKSLLKGKRRIKRVELTPAEWCEFTSVFRTHGNRARIAYTVPLHETGCLDCDPADVLHHEVEVVKVNQKEKCHEF